MTPHQSEVNMPSAQKIESLKPTQQQQTANGTNSVTVSSKELKQQQQEQQHIQKQKQQNKNNDNNKFLDRVLAAMNSTQAHVKSSAAKPPLPPTSVTQKNVMTNGIANAHNLTNGNNCRPPIKRLIDKTTLLQQQQESQCEGRTASNKLLSQYHKIPSSSSSSSVNGYASTGVSLTTSNAGNVNIIDNEELVNEIPVVEAMLTLPISTADIMSTSTTRARTTKYDVNGLGKTPLSSTSNGEYRRSSLIRTRSPSPTSSISSRCSSISSATTNSRTSTNYNLSRLQTPPRRIFPQTYTRGSNSLDVHEMQKLESSPVVFDANLSFVLGCKRQPVHQTFKPTPSYLDDSTSSAYLSEKIQNFLKRTDHVQEEWSAMGRRSRRAGSSTSSRGTTPTSSLYDNNYDTISLIERQRERKSMERDSSLGRSRSSQNILTKAFQMARTLPRTSISTSRSNSLARDYSESEDDRTIHEEEDRDMEREVN